MRPNFYYDNVTLITVKTEYIYKWEQIQMNGLRFALNLSRNINNNIVRRCADVSIIKNRIRELAMRSLDMITR